MDRNNESNEPQGTDDHAYGRAACGALILPPFLGRLCFCHVMFSFYTRRQPLPAVGFPGVAQEPGGPHAAYAATCDLPQKTSGARPVSRSETSPSRSER